MKILLTGGNGFIGRNILEILNKKYRFLAPSKKDLDLNDENLVYRYLQKNRPDVIIHAALAGGFGANKEKGIGAVFENNMRFFFNIVRAKEFYKKLIFFGSGAQYDKRQDLKKVKENDLGQSIPVDEYGFHKYLCCRFIEQTENITCLTLFGLYGKYEDYKFKFISNSIVKNLLKQEIVINQNVFFDYLFIDDFIAILDYFILNKLRFKNYNIVPNQSIDLITICKIINKLSDFKSKITVLNGGLNKEYTASNRRLNQEIPNLKFSSYKKGIQKLFEFYQDNLKNINKDFLSEDRYLESLLNNNKL